MKKVISVVSAALVALVLSSCSSTPAGSFDVKTISTTPHWNLESVKLSSWGTAQSTPTPGATDVPQRVNAEPAPVSTTAPVIVDSKLTETSSSNYIRLINKDNNCIAEGRIIYLESYKQSRGDEYNSKSYLYSLVPSSENPVADEKISKIDGTSYVTGFYTMPKALGNNTYHKTAVRTFSIPVGIEGASGFSKDEIGNYNSDLTVGLPTVAIDLSCQNAQDLQESLWNDVLNNFKLSFDALPVPTNTVK